MKKIVLYADKKKRRTIINLKKKGRVRMKNAKTIGIVFGLMLISGISYEIGASLPTFKLSDNQMNHDQLTDFYLEKERTIESLSNQIITFESMIIELEKLHDAITERIESAELIQSENRIETLKEQLEAKEEANLLALEERKAKINTQLENTQNQIQLTQYELERMQSQLEAWGN